MCSSKKIKMRKISSSAGSGGVKKKINKKISNTTLNYQHESSKKPLSTKKTNRTKTRKHKFLSDLRRELILSKSSSSSTNEINNENHDDDDDDDDQLIINLLFPLHPAKENQILFHEDNHHHLNDDHDHDHEEHNNNNNNNNMGYNYLFENGESNTLTGLLWGEEGIDHDHHHHHQRSSSSSSEDDDKNINSLSLPESSTYGYLLQGQQLADMSSSSNSLLIRTALKHRERDNNNNFDHHHQYFLNNNYQINHHDQIIIKDESSKIIQGLSLKLDYEKIMNAWSDKGSLYIKDYCSSQHSSQIVPDILNDDPFAQHTTNNFQDQVMLGDSIGSMLWRVPDHEHHDQDGMRNSTGIIKAIDNVEKEEDDEGMNNNNKMNQMNQMNQMEEREARVLRYKEKRQSRLFSKRIRYEVRKLNAEKRPRMKGRFVKRS